MAKYTGKEQAPLKGAEPEPLAPEGPAGRVRGRFAPGESGNRSGRPKGSRNRLTVLAQDLLDGEGDLIVRKAIELAKDGHPVAMRLCVERIIPPRLDRLVEFRMPRVARADDIASAMMAVIEAASKGQLTLEEAQKFTRLLEGQRRILETGELAMRLEVLELAEARKGRR